MTGFFNWLTELFGGAPKTKRIKVRVNLAKDASCWNYDLEADEPASQPFVKAGNKIEFPRGHPTSTIEFRLQGRTGHVLKFDKADPIWVDVGQCPTNPSEVRKEICILDTSDNKLEIQNKTLDANDLHYRLNFIDEAGNKVSWDPIIRNTGGGGP